MKREFAPERLNVPGFTAAAATLEAADPVPNYARLVAELATPATDAIVHWEATGEERPGADGKPVAWMHLGAEATVPLVCQRCLTPVDAELFVDRWFRFVADEATADAQDDEADEDLLVLSREFDLHTLIEDELLMEIPATPVHDVCPVPVQLSSSDEDFNEAEQAKPNPFAALEALRARKPEDGSKEGE
ncbi:YceD family protein [Variovorax sp. H27-G14]|uniref:YceD family protein n=1 Tax=Variovorax sp. H27-G14 TaxID=3111914 RepID=UPI0038FC3498